MASVLTRLRRMTRKEASWRVRTLVRTEAQRVAFAVRRPRWRARQLRRALRPDLLTPELRRAIEARDRMAAHRLLVDALRQREGRFVLDHGTSAAVRRAILARWPGADGDAAARADRMIGGVHDLLGFSGLDFAPEGAIDWHLDPVYGCRAPGGFWSRVPYLDPASGDHKVIWEINRHQHWLAFGRALWLTGDIRYRNAIVEQLASWMRANPPLSGINWASMLELGFRSIAWTCALHFLLAVEGNPFDVEAHDGPWLADMLIGLDRQLTHVEQNLSYYFSPNTHLTGEALALYVVGQALPELAGSARWVETGRRVLLDELARQVAPDGGHAERSTHYHRYTLDFYLLALLTARRCGDVDAELAFTDGVERLARFMRAMADGGGEIPVIGDDDAGVLWPIAGRHHRDVRDSLALAALVLGRPELAPWGIPEEAYWIGWSTHADAIEEWNRTDAQPVPAAAPVSTEIFPDTGYAVVRDERGSHLVFDVGQHGYLNGGHAHADALAIAFSIGGRPLLIDPGTGTYTMNREVRDRLRSSANHNTLTLDGRGPSVPAGPFHWASRTDARLDASRSNARLAWVEASHDGYAPIGHRRSIVHTPGGGWLIADEVAGHGRHKAELNWLFDPAWDVTCERNHRLLARHADGGTAWVLRDGGPGSLWLMHGDEESGAGWCSPSYGALLPTWSARIGRTAVGPFAMITWIGEAEGTPTLERLRAACDPTGTGVAVRVCDGDRSTVTLLRLGEPAARDTRSCSLREYQTNARLLQYAIRGGRLIGLAIADASHVLALRDGLLSVAADDAVDDLSVHVDGELLELFASRPPARLRLQGAAVAPIRRLRLNGRELRAARRRRDTLVISPADWGAPSLQPEHGREHEPRREHEREHEHERKHEREHEPEREHEREHEPEREHEHGTKNPEVRTDPCAA